MKLYAAEIFRCLELFKENDPVHEENKTYVQKYGYRILKGSFSGELELWGYSEIATCRATSRRQAMIKFKNRFGDDFKLRVREKAL